MQARSGVPAHGRVRAMAVWSTSVLRGLSGPRSDVGRLVPSAFGAIFREGNRSWTRGANLYHAGWLLLPPCLPFRYRKASWT